MNNGIGISLIKIWNHCGWDQRSRWVLAYSCERTFAKFRNVFCDHGDKLGRATPFKHKIWTTFVVQSGNQLPYRMSCAKMQIAEKPIDETLAPSMYYSHVWLPSKREELVISALATESWMQLQLHAEALPQIETILGFLHGAKWIFGLSLKMATGSSKLILVIVKRLHSLFPQKVIFSAGVLRSRIISWCKNSFS